MPPTSPDSQPTLGRTILNDFKRGDFERTLRRDFRELKEFMLTEERQKRLANMNQVKRWLIMSWWFLESLIMKLTPARRILLLFGIILLMMTVEISNDHSGSRLDVFHVAGTLLLLFVLMLELKDKLVAHEELEAGHAVQDALMPERTPQVAGWGIWLFTRSANEVGGDLVDFLQITPERIGITLGDIAGKGLSAALLTAKLQSTIRALVPDLSSFTEIGSKLNLIFCRDSLPNIFASLVYLEVQPNKGTLRLLNAGHPPPLLLRSGQIQKTEKGGLAIGLSPQATFTEQTVELGTNDLLFVYSDGLTEARNEQGSFFGEQRVLDLLPTLATYSVTQIGERLLTEVDRFIGEARAYDDISIAIIKRL